MNNFKSHFMFSREHRSGIFLLLLLIIGFQLFIYFYNASSIEKTIVSDEENKWMATQNEIDSLYSVNQKEKYQIKPFNPNFISDYKGYILGMSVAEIDRLHQFRNQNKFVNSAKEFQQITKVSNEFLSKISPYFKFPDWVNNPKTNFENKTFDSNQSYASSKSFEKKSKTIIPIDINKATKEDLMAVYGIGDKISDIILSEKEKFGAFASIDQLQFVWGVSPETFKELQKQFFVGQNPPIKKIDINNLSMKELSKFPYFNYALAKEIVTFRSMHDDIKNIEDLTKIKGLPNDKLKIIALYLEF